MPRNKTIMKFPTLNDRGGDLTKTWYVEWFYRMPGEEKPRYGRTSKGMCKGTADERRAAAEVAIRLITAELKRDDLLTARPEDVSPVKMRDTLTRPEADRYAAFLAANDSKLLAEEYVTWKKPRIRKSSFHTYKSKVFIFCQWMEAEKPLKTPQTISQEDMQQFFDWLVDKRQASTTTIKRYKQSMHDFYNWLQKYKGYKENPVYDICNRGIEKDHAPEPIKKEDVVRLREAIEKSDPYLWLQCQLQYYCAIRPGHEIRLMKVGDIHIDSHAIVIPAENAKNKKKAIVPIPVQVAELIKKLGIMNYAQDLYVFTADNRPGEKPVGEHTMKQRFNRIRDSLHISKAVKFYSWKHTGAISMVENGVDVWHLQQHMRHASITTTETYIKKRTAQAAEALQFIDTI